MTITSPGLISLKGINKLADQFSTISDNLYTTLKLMVGNLVDTIGCVGAVLVTFEADNTIVIRAYSINISSALVNTLTKPYQSSSFAQRMAINITQHPSFFGANFVEPHSDQTEPFALSNRLADIAETVFSSAHISEIQETLQIKQIIATPIWLQDETFGCLYAATNQNFTLQDINFLTAFSHQAATALQTERRLVEIQAIERVILALQSSITDETQILQMIVDAVVETLGYAGAIVATLEANNRLPVRAYQIDLNATLLQMLERQAGLSLISPKAVVHLDDPRCQDNLSVRAIRGASGQPEKFVISDQLYDLFRPIANRIISNQAQRIMKIKQVIAVPFYLEGEVVGNIFVATRQSQFTTRETELLTIFGQQAAVGLRNARLYKKAEERRQIAQMFGKMAFSATANIHALRNHIGSFHAFVRLLELSADLPEEQRTEVLEIGPNIKDHLNQASDILDTLHEPWQQANDTLVNVNTCLNWAIRKIFPNAALNTQEKETNTLEGVIVYRSLAENLPFVRTSPDMLTEALKVILKNASEAIIETRAEGHLWLETALHDDAHIRITISDDGAGIKPDVINKIFDMGWSSKKGQGMGFGLFWTKDFIEGLQGTIDVQSEWGQGTSFQIIVPTEIEPSNP
ncbi:MAG: ATP-binding protein [Chloroflexota bacterium]